MTVVIDNNIRFNTGLLLS